MENKMELYDAKITDVKSYNDIKTITFNYEEDDILKIVGIKYNGWMIDINTKKRYRILTKENSNEMEYGIDYENETLDVDFVVYYKKHNLEKDNPLKVQYYQMVYDKVMSKLPQTERFYYADIDYIASVKNEDLDYKPEPDEPKPVTFNENRSCKAIGIIRDDKFIDLKTYRMYNMIQVLSDKNAVYVDEHQTYAHNLLELNACDVSNEFRERAKNYIKPATAKITEFPVDYEHNNITYLFGESNERKARR